MNIFGHELSPILLIFNNRQLEKEYTHFIELETRLYIRVGIIISMLWWTFNLMVTFFAFPQHFRFLFPIISISTYPFFLFIVYASFKDKYIGHYQWMAAAANCIAGFLAIANTHYWSGQFSAYGALLGTMIILFFGYYIIRLRYIHAFVASLIYVAGYQIYLVFFCSVTSMHFLVLTYVTWLMLGTACFAGYIQETINRRLFIQKKMIKEQQVQIKTEYDRAEGLLLNILPTSIAEKLKQDQSIIADSFDSISVLFADIVGFTKISERFTPQQLVSVLNEIFSKFDILVENLGLEKIKTIGDAYMVAGGLPIKNNTHVEDLIMLSQQMQNELEAFNQKSNNNFKMRIGVHVGPAVAGVIGLKKFIYDIWGDTVNTASRMESHGIPGEIQVSEQTYELLKDTHVFEERGEIDVKGKGIMRTYLLKNRL
ncbi:adenylate/guanylate cyclase domain-containing protein [bacterium]|nr:adenylate/guanylate cyclase domain-containing protein [bacterium]